MDVGADFVIVVVAVVIFAVVMPNSLFLFVLFFTKAYRHLTDKFVISKCK